VSRGLSRLATAGASFAIKPPGRMSTIPPIAVEGIRGMQCRLSRHGQSRLNGAYGSRDQTLEAQGAGGWAWERDGRKRPPMPFAKEPL
jgi:hypothetical protein